MSTKQEQERFELDPEARRLPQYQEGKQAFFAGSPVADCPHPSGFKRTSWMSGWYDERTRSRLGHIFDRRGMKWP